MSFCGITGSPKMSENSKFSISILVKLSLNRLIVFKIGVLKLYVKVITSVHVSSYGGINACAGMLNNAIKRINISMIERYKFERITLHFIL